jgi:Family of unknown function (DUF5305)
MENVAILKSKNVLRNNWAILFIIFGSMLAFSSYQMYQGYINPSFEEKNITVSSYTQYGTYSYSTIVSEPNPLYLTGTTLGMNESAYYFVASSIPNFSFVYRIDASDSANVTAIPKTIVIARSKNNDYENSKIMWQKEFPVTPISLTGSSTVKNEDSTNSFTYRFLFNAATIENAIENTQYGLNYPPTWSSTFDASAMTYEIKTLVNYNGTINGKQVENTTSFVLPMTMTKSYYELSKDVSTNVTDYNNETVSVQNPFTVETIKYPLASMLISIIAIIGIIYCRIAYDPDPVQMAKLEQDHVHAQFKEFISEGKLPENRSSLMALKIASLQELINAAIDMNERVIYDSSENIHFAIHNGVLYYFTNTISSNEAKSEDVSGGLPRAKVTNLPTSVFESTFKDP